MSGLLKDIQSGREMRGNAMQRIKQKHLLLVICDLGFMSACSVLCFGVRQANLRAVLFTNCMNSKTHTKMYKWMSDCI